nr:hypothetical protein CTI12_AA423330 [Tanacetum cinerariifolium]
MSVKPTVALRALLVGGIATFAKIAGAAKAAGCVKLGAAAAAEYITKHNVPNDVPDDAEILSEDDGETENPVVKSKKIRKN